MKPFLLAVALLVPASFAHAELSAVQCLRVDAGVNCIACKKVGFGNTCRPVELDAGPFWAEAEAKAQLPVDPPKPPEPDASIPALPAASGALALTVAAFAAGRRSKNNEA